MNASQQWNADFAFAREQIKKELANARTATLHNRRNRLRYMANIDPNNAAAAGAIVGIVDLLCERGALQGGNK